jgi:hypothetical protein
VWSLDAITTTHSNLTLLKTASGTGPPVTQLVLNFFSHTFVTLKVIFTTDFVTRNFFVCVASIYAEFRGKDVFRITPTSNVE